MSLNIFARLPPVPNAETEIAMPIKMAMKISMIENAMYFLS